MEHYRVIRNKEEDKYYFVFADLIKKRNIDPEKFEILKEDDPTARRMLDEFASARLITWDDLVCESEHYLFYASLQPHFWDWMVLK